MFIIEQQDRMGNAMFQFAFGHALARRHRCFWCLTWLKPLRYFELGPYRRPRHRAARWAVMKFRGGLKRLGVRVLKTVEVDNFHPARPLGEYATGVAYRGYFQSEAFFAEARDEVAAMLQVKPQYRAAFEERYGDLFQRSQVAVVHVRRTDYVAWSYGGSTGFALGEQYYLDCLSQIENLPSLSLLFISDDLPWAREKFGHIANARFEKNDEITDFQLLLNADRLILSASSFAWWGAYLNKKPGKVIYAPKHWLGFKLGREIPPGVIPKGWVQVDASQTTGNSPATPAAL